MISQLALFGCLLFSLWLTQLDRKWRSGVSLASWLVVVWIAILASRPVSAWLSLGGGGEMSDNEVDGNSADRNVFLVLIIAALYVLKKRHVNWHEVISRNKWIFLFYLFFGLSIVWSDYSFIALKRWIKDLGNILMVLLVLTEKNPLEAVRAVFARCAYFLIPLSVLFIKFYPGLGVSYYRFSGRPTYQGVAMGKNLLGITALVLSLFLIWEFLEIRKARKKKGRKPRMMGVLLLLLMSAWLFAKANSATSLACALFGSFGLIVLALPFVRRRLEHLFAYSVAALVLMLLLSSVMDLSGGAAGMLGRDSSLTGRDAIWKLVLAEKTNPLIGTGFYSFWLGNRSEALSEKNGYHFRLNEAHNGYLEIYLNGGAIGVGLLLMMLATSGRKIKDNLVADPDWNGVRLIFLLVIAMHNWSEATFTRTSPLWFVLLLVCVEYGRSSQLAPARNLQRRSAVARDENLAGAPGPATAS